MARLDKTARERIGEQLRSQVPKHWRVVVGADGHAFIEVDQDGRKPSHRFHEIGSKVIDVRNRRGGWVEARIHERVKFPAGYCEGRKDIGQVAKVKGSEWAKDLVDAIAAAVGEADVAALGGTATGKA